MANYYASARSNYFEVKDEKAFTNDINSIPGLEAYKALNGLYCLLVNDADGGGWPSYYIDEDDNEEEVNLIELISGHLKDNQVCILMEIGSEKLRYLIGEAVAFNNKGETRRVSLGQIYDLAKELGTDITTAEY